VAEGLPILMRIPYDRTIAGGTAQGRPLVDIRQEYLPAFQGMWDRIVDRADVRP
jgi:MinD superfamily P-loop ATPase